MEILRRLVIALCAYCLVHGSVYAADGGGSECLAEQDGGGSQGDYLPPSGTGDQCVITSEANSNLPIPNLDLAKRRTFANCLLECLKKKRRFTPGTGVHLAAPEVIPDLCTCNADCLQRQGVQLTTTCRYLFRPTAADCKSVADAFNSGGMVLAHFREIPDQSQSHAVTVTKITCNSTSGGADIRFRDPRQAGTEEAGSSDSNGKFSTQDKKHMLNGSRLRGFFVKEYAAVTTQDQDETAAFAPVGTGGVE